MPDGFRSTIKASLPQPPQRQFSFTAVSVNTPTAQQPGDRMDAEYDRSNQATTELINFVSVTFNTDGTLRPGTVGMAQLDPSIVGDITADINADVQPSVDDAQAFANSAAASANAAAADAATAAQASNNAQGAAASSSASASQSATSSLASQQYASSAQVSAIDAENAANSAEESEALTTDLTILAQAWAEHMPDTIPPQTLAVMNITGDHWSSRWWAHHAEDIVSTANADLDALGEYWVGEINDTGQAWVGAIQSLYLGAFYYPPTTDAFGNPVATGALYYNIVLEAPFVWNGTAWVAFVTPSPSQVYKYIYVATANQTVFTGLDRNGHTLAYNSANRQQISVWRKGLLLTPVDDYTTAVNTVTLKTGAAAGDIVQIYVEATPSVELDWTTVKLNTSGWTATGGPIIDTQGHPVNPAAATDVFVSVDGVWQDAVRDYIVSANVITFTTPNLADAVVFGLAIVPSQQAPVPVGAVTKLDTSSWVFNGASTTFPLLDGNGATITPPSAVNVLLSLDGVWLQALVDYTVSAGSVTFTTPPAPDALVFGLSGLPSFT